MRWSQPGHYAPYAPEAIQRLPFNLLRSHKYPRDPELVGEAIRDYRQDRPPSTLIPQRMAFTKWKSPPYDTAYGQNAVSVIKAYREAEAFRERLAGSYPQVPIETAVQAKRNLGADQLPQPSANLNPNLYTQPAARNAVALNTMVSAETLNRYAQSINDGEFLRKYKSASKTSDALQSVTRQNKQFLDSVVRHGKNDPWFLREPNGSGQAVAGLRGLGRTDVTKRAAFGTLGALVLSAAGAYVGQYAGRVLSGNQTWVRVVGGVAGGVAPFLFVSAQQARPVSATAPVQDREPVPDPFDQGPDVMTV